MAVSHYDPNSNESIVLPIKFLIVFSNLNYLSLVVRKPDFGVSDQVLHKPGCTASEDGKKPEMSDLGSRGIVLFM